MAIDLLADIFPGDSEMSRRMRAHDWGACALGDPRSWPEGLKVPLGMMLNSRFEMWLGWGEDLAFFYNDAYVPTLGVKHPHALGQPFREVWREIVSDVEDQVASVMVAGHATWNEALMLLLTRSGFPEETYHTFSYSPLRGRANGIEGLMCVVTEVTERVIGERRMNTLRELATALGPARSVEDVTHAFAATLADNGRDFPFVLQYRFDDAGQASALTADAAAALEAREWPFVKVWKGALIVLINLDAALTPLPTGAWDRPPAQALLIPVVQAGRAAPSGVLILGLNPYRAVETDIVSFAQLLAGQFAGAMANVETLDAQRQRADRLWRLFERAPSFMAILTGPGHTFEFANEAYYRLIGTRDILGKSVREALPDLTGQGFFELLDTVFTTGERYGARDVPVTLQLTPGAAPEQRFVNFVFEPVVSATGEISSIFVEGHDVTDMHVAQVALRQLNETLESRVEERTRELELAQDALRQSQKLEAMGQLTGGVAHDFNNLLTPIIGGLDMLQRRRLGGSREQRLIEGAAQSADRAKILVQRLLAFSRRQPLQSSAVDVAALVEGMAGLVASTLGPQIRVLVDVPPDLPHAMADANQLEMALLNLSVNARDAMPAGGTLTITGRRQSVLRETARLKRGHYVCITVVDTGTGMDEETLARAIEPFFSTKGVGKGTGLGLSMVHGLASQLGGVLEIASTPGLGTSVQLWLPMSALPLDEPAPDRGFVPAAPIIGRALLVDDEALVRATTADMLTDLGFDVAEAESAEDALRLIAGGLQADLVVSDHLMPGQTGVELAREIQALSPHTPILIVSGYADVEGIDPDLPRLTKPFRLADLAAALADAGFVGRPE